MTLDQGVILGILGAAVTVALTAIGRLFLLLLAAKDAHIAELRETLKYQRSIGEINSRTAHRAVDALERVTP